MRTGELYQRYNGLYLGTVVSTDDPEGMGRVRVHMDQYDDSGDPVYAAVVRPVANADTTVFFSPQSGDQVIVGFLVGDVNEPIILGYAHSKEKKPPSEVSPPNVHGIVTSIGRVTFDEDAKKIEVVFNGLGSSLESSITMDKEGLKIHSNFRVAIQAPLVTVDAPVMGFAGTPTFVPNAPDLPKPGEQLSKAKMDFTSTGVEIQTALQSFCVNGQGVLLTGFLENIYNTHVHVVGSPNTATPLPPGVSSDPSEATPC